MSGLARAGAFGAREARLTGKEGAAEDLWWLRREMRVIHDPTYVSRQETPSESTPGSIVGLGQARMRTRWRVRRGGYVRVLSLSWVWLEHVAIIIDTARSTVGAGDAAEHEDDGGRTGNVLIVNLAAFSRPDFEQACDRIEFLDVQELGSRAVASWEPVGDGAAAVADGAETFAIGDHASPSSDDRREEVVDLKVVAYTAGILGLGGCQQGGARILRSEGNVLGVSKRGALFPLPFVDRPTSP